jgi:uncharacterized membrane protein
MENHGKSTFGLDANLVALLCYLANFVCYLGLVLSVITVIQEKTNKLARFHALQSIFLFIASILLVPVYFVMMGLMFAGSTITTLVGGILGLVLTVVGLAVFVFMIIAAIKGFQGEQFKIPVIGNFAEKYV